MASASPRTRAARAATLLQPELERERGSPVWRTSWPQIACKLSAASSGRVPVSAGHVLQPEVVTPTGPEPGSTAECDSCGTAVLLVSGPAVDLWCHGMRMRTAEGVRCSEPVGPQHGGGLIAGAIYMERTTSSMLRCTRSRSGWPKSRTGALAPASPADSSPRCFGHEGRSLKDLVGSARDA